MTFAPEDHLLLDECRAALAVPFADPVQLGGVSTPRRAVRSMERLLLRLKVNANRERSEGKRERASAGQAGSQGRGCARPAFEGQTR